VAYLFELFLFLLPFAAYALWRRMNPKGEPSTMLLVLGGAGILCMVAGAVWYGLSRSFDRGAVYVPAHAVDGRIEPGRAEPRR
jgi:hypothetical protein